MLPYLIFISLALMQLLCDLPKGGPAGDKKEKGPVRVKVVHTQPPRTYTNANNREMTVVECIIADTTGASKLSCYNKTAFPMLQTGRSVMILNLISKQREIVVTSEGKILMIPDLEIPEEHDTAAKALIPQLTNPTGAAEKTILEIHELPTGTLVSCTAKVVEVRQIFQSQ